MVQTGPVAARGAWSGEAHLLLDALAYSLSEARRADTLPSGRGAVSRAWRHEVLASLAALTDVLIAESSARPGGRGSRVARDRSRLLADLRAQQGQVRSEDDLDRLLHDLRRLLVQARLHVHTSLDA